MILSRVTIFFQVPKWLSVPLRRKYRLRLCITDFNLFFAHFVNYYIFFWLLYTFIDRHSFVVITVNRREREVQWAGFTVK